MYFLDVHNNINLYTWNVTGCPSTGYAPIITLVVSPYTPSPGSCNSISSQSNTFAWSPLVATVTNPNPWGYQGMQMVVAYGQINVGQTTPNTAYTSGTVVSFWPLPNRGMCFSGSSPTAAYSSSSYKTTCSGSNQIVITEWASSTCSGLVVQSTTVSSSPMFSDAGFGTSYPSLSYSVKTGVTSSLYGNLVLNLCSQGSSPYPAALLVTPTQWAYTNQMSMPNCQGQVIQSTSTVPIGVCLFTGNGGEIVCCVRECVCERERERNSIR